MKDPRELNALYAKYKREADAHGIGSPYRINEYVQYRLKGMSQKRAIEKTKKPR